MSEITYAIVLSRIDKLMVTMLSGELVAGNFGQSRHARHGGQRCRVREREQGGAGWSKSNQDMNDADTARNDLETKRTALNTSVAALNQCPPDDAACRKTKQEDVNAKRGDFDVANSKFTTAFLKARGAVAASTASSASALIAQGTAPCRPLEVAVERPPKWSPGSQKFVENINADPVVVACLTALDRDGGADSTGHGRELVTFCKRSLVDILDFQKDLLRARLIDGQTTLVHSCMAAFQDATSADPKVKDAAGKLVTFCKDQLVNILNTQANIVSQQRALEDARRVAPAASEDKKPEPAATR